MKKYVIILITILIIKLFTIAHSIEFNGDSYYLKNGHWYFDYGGESWQVAENLIAARFSVETCIGFVDSIANEIGININTKFFNGWFFFNLEGNDPINIGESLYTCNEVLKVHLDIVMKGGSLPMPNDPGFLFRINPR